MKLSALNGKILVSKAYRYITEDKEITGVAKWGFWSFIICASFAYHYMFNEEFLINFNSLHFTGSCFTTNVNYKDLKQKIWPKK